MNIVKPLKTLNLPRSPKKQFFYRNEKLSIFLLSSLIGTYLDLYFVGKGLYSFPIRLFPEIFTINIAFTIGILPVFSIVFIDIVKNMRPLNRWISIVLISLLMAVGEKLSTGFGFFIHTEEWKHFYTFFGYMMFLFVIWRFYRWIKGRGEI